MKHRHSLFTITTFAKISIRRYFRDKTALFFTVLFPLIFLFIFGNLNGKSSNVSFHIALINQSDSNFSKQLEDKIKASKTFKVEPDISTLDEAKQHMSRSEIDAAVVLPTDFGTLNDQGIPTGQAIVHYDENNAQSAQALTAILQGTFENINTQLTKIQPPLTVISKSTNETGLTRFDYTFAGLLGFSILGLGLFGPVNYFPAMKKQGVLRRLHITPIRVWQFFVSSVLSNSVIGLFSMAIMLIVAMTVFDFRMAGSLIELAIVIVFGILCIFGIGLAIGGWAKNENQAAPLANIIAFPLMFLSGTFFPRFLMPEWLQNLTQYLPLTPIIDAIRIVATEGKHLIDVLPQLGLISIWTVIIYVIAFRTFRWE